MEKGREQKWSRKGWEGSRLEEGGRCAGAKQMDFSEDVLFEIWKGGPVILFGEDGVIKKWTGAGVWDLRAAEMSKAYPFICFV